MKRTMKKCLSVILATVLLCMMAVPGAGAADGTGEEALMDIYRSYVQQHFSKNYIAVHADVTHDGVDELIVVDRSHEEDPDYTTYGYVYTYKNGQVTLIGTKKDATFHGGGEYFSLALSPRGDGTYNMISEVGALWQGSGDVSLVEYHIDNATGDLIITRTYDKVSSQYPVSDARWEQYFANCNRALKDAYIVYVYQWYYTEGKALPQSMIVAQG